MCIRLVDFAMITTRMVCLDLVCYNVFIQHAILLPYLSTSLRPILQSIQLSSQRHNRVLQRLKPYSQHALHLTRIARVVRIRDPLPRLAQGNPIPLLRDVGAHDVRDFLRVVRALGDEEALVRGERIRQGAEGGMRQILDVYPYCRLSEPVG